MHEGAMMQTVVTTILNSLEKTHGGRVTHIQLELGTSEHFTEEAVRQYFQMLTQDTPAAGAELDLIWLPAIYQCLSCLRRFESTSSTGICPHCGEVGLEVAHRDGCDIRQIEIVLPDTYAVED
ncbi:MAG TPA: hydrogenase maturation nickel metallochaperone HypA [Ktedonobacteraceae bacterium]